MTKEQILEAFGWLVDCFDDVPADITDSEVIHGVARHYDGGVTAFLADGGW